MTTVYLIRHAHTLGNEQKIFQGNIESPLSKTGESQLLDLREACKDIKFDAIFTSPLSRARKTAEAVNFYHGVPIEAIDELREISGGDLEGKLWSEFGEICPEAFGKWESELWDFSAPNGEKMSEVFDRMRKIVIQIVENNKNKTIGIVSHGCAIKNFLTFANNMPITDIDKTLWCDNTAISKIEFDDFYNTTVVFVNDTSHLDGGNKTFVGHLWGK